ncbi:MAG: hypothetical protein IPM94_00395 [bacterium]|nr:hypothetical protein [bacterium]
MRHRPLLSSLVVLLAGVVLAAGSLPAADVTFVHRAPGAKEVTLAGSFNGWKAFDLALKDTGGGVWAVVVPLDEGTYEYKFVVDGAWRQDPANPVGKDDGYGGQNSVVVVPAGTAKLTAGGGEAPAGLKATPVATAAAPAAGAAAGMTVFSHNAGKGAACFLAGEFNGWNPTSDRMEDPDGDGVHTKAMALPPGRYMYKFVVDGNWLADPAAAESAEDGFGGQNSVVTVGAGAAVAPPPAAAKVVATPVAAAAGGKTRFAFDAGGKIGSCFLAGEFNGWNATGQSMDDPDGDGVYTADVDLAPGRYMYKFVVDGNWKQDPQNPEGVDDGFGGKNSVITVGAGGAAVAPAPAAAPSTTPAPAAGGAPVEVTFTYTPVISGVQNVFLAGSFNGWSDAALRLTDPENDGTYSVVVPLAPGNHQYKFVVDGNWQQDPGNAAVESDGFGGNNSLVVVKTGAAAVKAAETGAVRAATGTRTVPFKYAAGKSAKDVFLAGTFNDWNDSKQRLADADGDGVWETSLLLQPGSYQYKFVVDGQWKQDPANPEGRDDGFGGQNSVLEVDESFSAVAIARGDGKVYTDDLEPVFDYSTCNPLTATEIELTARAHLNDVERVELSYRVDGGDWMTAPMTEAEHDPAYQYYRVRVTLPGADSVLEYAVRYVDGAAQAWLGAAGPSPERPAAAFRYTRAIHPPFLTPDWAKDGVIYQIFADRFRNGDPANDPDFSEAWYQGVNKLPASGTTNGEYFHLVADWNDVSGLVRSPYRTDGKPDYYSFYGGDIAGVREKLDYLQDLGVTVIYFNPLNQAMSNHKYDPVDYNTVDPHFADEAGFKAFVQDAHGRGIRIVVDMAFNHTGNWHYAFRDAVEKGKDSQYWNWYEFKRWPLPASRDFTAADYYDCWWGFGLHPNLNWDLSRPNSAENGVSDRAQAQVNQPLVDYVLSVAQYWLGDLDIDGFRLDVPNEVPFWFWEEFNAACKRIKPDSWLVGEIWGNAGSWIGPHCFDATMNYKYFRDPVMEFFGQSRIDAATFDQRLSPGRFVYPPQSVQTMMNLIDSHDTVRFLTTSKDVRRQMLAAMFAMTYVGMPHIWYGDEIGMEGDKDPDCRRPFDWRYENDPRKAKLRDYYGTITRFRRDHQVLARGEFATLAAEGPLYAFARRLGTKGAVVLLNNGPQPVTLTLTAAQLAAALPAGGSTVYKVVAGPDWFPSVEGGTLTSGRTLELGQGDVAVTLPGMSGAVLAN